MMFQTSDNSQLYSSQQLTIVWSLIHHSTQTNLIFSRVKILHLDRLKEGTWLYSFASIHYNVQSCDGYIYFFFIRLSGNDARKDRKLSPISESLGCIMFRGLPRKAPFSALNLAANTIHKNHALCQVQKGWRPLFHKSRFDAPYLDTNVVCTVG